MNPFNLATAPLPPSPTTGATSSTAEARARSLSTAASGTNAGAGDTSSTAEARARSLSTFASGTNAGAGAGSSSTASSGTNAGAGAGATSSTAGAGAGSSSTAAAGTTAGAGAGAGATSSTAGASTAAAINPKSIDLLKRRYGLPESLIRHGLPNQPVQISGEKMSGIVVCTADAQRLDEQSKELGIQDLHIYYAAYTPVSTVFRSETLFKKPRVGSVLCNNTVAKGKLQSCKVLKDLEDRFEKTAEQLQADAGKEKRKALMEMRGSFASESEIVTCRLEMLENLKEKALDNLMFLLLDSTSGFADFGEALWILRQHRPADYKLIVPHNSEISLSGIIAVRKSILERREGKFSTGNIFQARSFVLAVFGRIHMETVLEQVIATTKGALKTYMTAIEDVLLYEALAIASIKEQQKCICRLTQKRSLIGCYPVYLAGDDEDDEDSEEYIVDYDEEEEEDYDYYSLEEVCVESPIADNSSLIDSDDELEDEPKCEEAACDNEEPGFLRFQWDFGANPSEEVERYKRYILFLEYCYC